MDSTSGLSMSKTFCDIWLKITPLMLFSLNVQNPFNVASVDTLAPRLLISRMVGASSFSDTSHEDASVPAMVVPS